MTCNKYKYGWLLYHKKDIDKNRWFIDNFIEKFKIHNVTLELVPADDFDNIINNRIPDFAIVRAINPYYNRKLEKSGVRVYNSSLLSEISNNKANAVSFVNNLSIPHIPTCVLRRDEKTGELYIHRKILNSPEFSFLEYYDSLIKNFGKKSDYEKYIIKSVSGHGGREVFILNEFDSDNIIPMEAACEKYYSDKYVIQPYIDCGNKDLRVYIIGGKIIGAVVRHGISGFKANYSLGGEVSLYELRQDQKNTVMKIANELKADYCGIDFLLFGNDDTLIFNEIEDVVGARMLSECSTKNKEIHLQVDIIEKHF